ncbi:MAG: hypothetical protein K0R17_3745 [Rariglobus sp.]|jgi:hypothetical protein|nr:hypothetical protein [Rariglobus sp.]
MNFLRLLLLSSLLWHAAARADEAVTLLRPGETLTYRVGWGVLGHAGDLKISAQAETIDDAARLRVTTTSSSRGLVRMLYPFDGDVWTLFDPHDGRLLGASATTRSSKEKTHATITFDYEKREASYVDHLNASRSAAVPLPDGRPMDLITALIQARAWGLTPGQSRDAMVLFDDEFYALKITAEREETITTPKGPRRTLLLIPRMIGKPKGMFRRGGEVRVWVSADEDRLPLRFEVKLKVGTAYAVLTDYRPPAEAK